MNCFSGAYIQLTFIVSALFLFIAEAAGQTISQRPDDKIYGADYTITPDVANAGALVELRISQSRQLLRELSMTFDDKSISGITGDGQVIVVEGRIRWLPPADGGRLRWFSRINHLRDGTTYDAFVAEDWALFRAEDVIPPTAIRTLKGSVSKTRLMFDLPVGWTAVTEYFRRWDVHDVSIADRRFDRPTGWIVLGKLGVRNETIAGVRVVVAAPVGHGVRRLDIVAMLSWTLPDLLRLLPDFPHRLTVVSADEPMWRGALSAPRSFYVHADRPLISENGTSTILHEMLHIGLSVGAVDGADWIVEGLAEYYGLEILRRSGTISEKRYRSARAKLAEWGESVKSMCTDSSTGAVTAKAVSVLEKLDADIRSASDRKFDLDDVLRRVAGSESKVSIKRLRQISTELAGGEVQALSDRSLNNCEN
jgi:hypothetical protein